ITGNAITGNAVAGVYIKTGGNLVRENTISGNGDGISIVGTDPPTPGGTPPSYDPGHKNVIQAKSIENNDTVGIQLPRPVDTLVGFDALNASAGDSTVMRPNGTHGVSFDATSSKNVVFGNTIHGNGFDGVTVEGPTTSQIVDSRNKITRNSITANGRSGI